MNRKYRPSLIPVILAALFVASFFLQDRSDLGAMFVTRAADIALWFVAIIMVLGVLIPMEALRPSDNASPYRFVMNSIITLLPVSIYAPPFVTVILILCVMVIHAKLTTWLKDLNELQSNDSNL